MASPTASACRNAYRFWSNPKVSVSQILASHRDGVVARSREAKTVLAIQDTTDLNFTSHPSTEGLGFINQSKQQGIKVHSCLAVSGDGSPLGLLHQQCWAREQQKGKAKAKRQKPIEQKESYRWLQTLQAAEVGLASLERVIHVGDREADIFELFATPRRASSELLLRVGHNRKVRHELGYLVPTLEQAPLRGTTAIDINRNPKQPARTAQLQVRAMEVTIEVPRYLEPKRLVPQLLNVILVEELDPSDEVKQPIRWLLATTLPIETFEQVWQAVQWYSYRWLIERFHFTLKSGCRIEGLQLRSKDRLLKALATYSIVAWRLMSLTYQARLTPETSCERVLQPKEWKLLRRKFAPKNRSKKPPSLKQAMIWIARLGGFFARKGDGDPGLKTIWRGLGKLQLLLEGAQLAAQS